jgi:hypothetical protein
MIDAIAINPQNTNPNTGDSNSPIDFIDLDYNRTETPESTSSQNRRAPHHRRAPSGSPTILTALTSSSRENRRAPHHRRAPSSSPTLRTALTSTSSQNRRAPYHRRTPSSSPTPRCHGRSPPGAGRCGWVVHAGPSSGRATRRTTTPQSRSASRPRKRPTSKSRAPARSSTPTCNDARPRWRAR